MRAHGRHRARRATFVGLAAAIGLLTTAGPAAAHNVLVSSDPAANAVLARAPGAVTLVFDQDVQNVYAEMAITVGSQAAVEFTPTVNGHDVTASLGGENLKIPVQSGLVPWKIGYRIVSADGHPVTGLVNFSVGVAAARAATSGPAVDSAGSAAAPASTSGGVPWLVISGGVVLVFVLAAIVLTLIRRRGSTDC